MNIEKVYVVNDENYSKDSIRKCAYINVASGKPSFQNCVIMKAYASLEEAKENLQADRQEFYKRYGKCNWYIDDFYGHIATIDNPYYTVV